MTERMTEREALFMLARFVSKVWGQYGNEFPTLSRDDWARLRAFAERPAEEKPALTVAEIDSVMRERITRELGTTWGETTSILICARVAFDLLEKESRP